MRLGGSLALPLLFAAHLAKISAAEQKGKCT